MNAPLHVDPAISDAVPPRVDAHAHIFTADMPLAASAWHAPAGDASAGQYLATLDAQGVDFGVLAAASLFGFDNRYALGMCRQHRRLRTTVIVPPDVGIDTLRAMAADGAVGVRFQLRHVAEPPDFTSAPYRRLLRDVRDLGWHVQLHDDSPRLPRHLDGLEAAGVDIVVDHFGRPGAEAGLACPGFQRLLASVATGRTWVKLSAAFRLPTWELARDAAQALLQHAGPERLMWGSDWPFVAFEGQTDFTATLRAFEALVPDAALRRRIAGDTPMRLYFPDLMDSDATIRHPRASA